MNKIITQKRHTTIAGFGLLLITLLFYTSNAHTQTMWSDPATWGGNIPIAGDDVVITSAMYVILDQDTPNLRSLTIEGRLDFDNQDLNVTSEWILVTGQLNVGSEAVHYTHQAIFTLTGIDTSEVIVNHIKATRGIIVRGGILELHGDPPLIPWTKINANAAQGSTSLTLIENVDWQVGDQIAIAPTDFYEAGLTQNSITQRATLTNIINNTDLTIDQGLNAFRWGVLQYATATGMSLSPLNRITPPVADTDTTLTPTILDERASVGNLTRNIIIQAPDDAAWNNSGLGVHVMIMRSTAGHHCNQVDAGHQGVAHVDGVEFRRGGQRKRLGRYPFHWHMMSYCGTQTLEDATGQYLRNSSINSSMHRAVVIHGTNGVEVSNNVIYDIKSHAIFLEDAAERRNLFDGNLVLHIRNHDAFYDGLKFHERGPANIMRGSSGFWISNPDNTVINNTAADCVKSGFWLPFPPTPIGLNINIDMHPNRLLFGVFENNTAHSNGLEGIRRDDAESTLPGIDTTRFWTGGKYMSTIDGEEPLGDQSTRRPVVLKSYKVWKNGISGIWDRSDWSRNDECISADNQTRFFAGAGKDGFIKRSLTIGTSLNYLMNNTGRSNIIFGMEPAPSAFATYHSDFSIQDNIVINFPAIDNTLSGVFATGDYYIRGVEKGQLLNSNNLLINSNMGVRVMANFPWFTLSGALWDPYANWGTIPENYIVYDTPFFTYNQVVEILQPSTEVVGAMGTAGPYYSFGDFAINKPLNPRNDYMELQVERLDAFFNVVGTWHVDEAVEGIAFFDKRHFATHPSSVYRLLFPSLGVDIYDIAMTTNNFLSADDKQVVAIPYSASATILQVYYTSTSSVYMDDAFALTPSSDRKHNYSSVASRQAVIDSDGETYWQDTANELVWIKIQGGLIGSWGDLNAVALRDETIYKQSHFRIFGQASLLPIDLINFTAQLNAKNEVKLSWSTASETNNNFFTIERSADSRNWKKTIKLQSQGDSNQTQYYKTIDTNPLKGTSYYRLKQTDYNDDFSYSDIVTIHLNENQFARIYPNPTNGLIHVEMEENVDKTEVEIVDIKGQKILSHVVTGVKNFKINTSLFPNGLYSITIKTAREISTLKLVKY